VTRPVATAADRTDRPHRREGARRFLARREDGEDGSASRRAGPAVPRYGSARVAGDDETPGAETPPDARSSSSGVRGTARADAVPGEGITSWADEQPVEAKDAGAAVDDAAVDRAGAAAHEETDAEPTAASVGPTTDASAGHGLAGAEAGPTSVGVGAPEDGDHRPADVRSPTQDAAATASDPGENPAHRHTSDGAETQAPSDAAAAQALADASDDQGESEAGHASGDELTDPVRWSDVGAGVPRAVADNGAEAESLDATRGQASGDGQRLVQSRTSEDDRGEPPAPAPHPRGSMPPRGAQGPDEAPTHIRTATESASADPGAVDGSESDARTAGENRSAAHTPTAGADPSAAHTPTTGADPGAAHSPTAGGDPSAARVGPAIAGGPDGPDGRAVTVLGLDGRTWGTQAVLSRDPDGISGAPGASTVFGLPPSYPSGVRDERHGSGDGLVPISVGSPVRRRIAAGAAVAVLLGGAVVALVGLGADDGETASEQTTTTTVSPSTGAPSTTPATTTTTAPPTTTTVPPTTTTTAPSTTTTTAAPTTTVAPTTTAPPTTVPPTTTPVPDVYYEDCYAANEAGAAPIYEGQPGYRPELDWDGNGIACEWFGGRD